MGKLFVLAEELRNMNASIQHEEGKYSCSRVYSTFFQLTFRLKIVFKIKLACTIPLLIAAC